MIIRLFIRIIISFSFQKGRIPIIIIILSNREFRYIDISLDELITSNIIIDKFRCNIIDNIVDNKGIHIYLFYNFFKIIKQIYMFMKYSKGESIRK